MLVSIEQAATVAAFRQRDPEVRQTGADEMNDLRPSALDSAVLRRAQRELGISNLPVIFDLPVPDAIKRAEEFARYINPLLQVNCAKCHDGEYDGAFQLVSTKRRSDHTPDALRANLDATLRLVDPKNPARSELLSSTLRPHGRGQRPRPIFPGSNDPTYQILARWVQNLCPPAAGAARTGRNEVKPRPSGSRPSPLTGIKLVEIARTRTRLRFPVEPGGRSLPRGWRRKRGSHRPRGSSPVAARSPRVRTRRIPRSSPCLSRSRESNRTFLPRMPRRNRRRPVRVEVPPRLPPRVLPTRSPEQAKGKDGSETAKKSSKPLKLDPASRTHAAEPEPRALRPA